MAPDVNTDESTEIAALPGMRFDTSYARLPERFYARIHARSFSSSLLVKLNEKLAEELGLDIASADRVKLAEILSGSDLPGDGNLLAMAYSGHQFGQFNPGLGDGRAGLIGEVINPKNERFDVQLKGSGPTPFSRNGDGLAALGPVMREYIVSEAMHALGTPTTRSLAIVLTGDRVWREQVFPGAVLTRVAASHLRIGTFQYFAARGDREGIQLLTDYAINRHYPELADDPNPPLALLKKVIERQSELVVKWMGFGFIHGVMNTDNMTISGETIDYGPCAFMDHYDHGKVYSSIDRQGRYAYGNQPQIAQWNLARLAETLVPLIDKDEGKAIGMATEAVQDFAHAFSNAWQEVFAAKTGLQPGEPTTALVRDYLTLMQKHSADFTTAFRLLHESAQENFAKGDLVFLFKADPAFDEWFGQWKEAVTQAGQEESVTAMGKANPVYIPRNHLVEAAIRAGEDHEDFQPMENLLRAVFQPFNKREGLERFAVPPEPGEEITRTFCGT